MRNTSGAVVFFEKGSARNTSSISGCGIVDMRYSTEGFVGKLAVWPAPYLEILSIPTFLENWDGLMPPSFLRNNGSSSLSKSLFICAQIELA